MCSCNKRKCEQQVSSCQSGSQQSCHCQKRQNESSGIDAAFFHQVLDRIEEEFELQQERIEELEERLDLLEDLLEECSFNDEEEEPVARKISRK